MTPALGQFQVTSSTPRSPSSFSQIMLPLAIE